MKILFNDINHYMAANQYTLCETREHKQDFFHNNSLLVHTSLSIQYKWLNFSVCTEGINAGKRVSDILFMI